MNTEIKIYLTDRVLCSPDWSWQSSSNGWKGYHIWCVEKGKAYVLAGHESYTLFPGDLFLFDLKEEHICTHNPEDPLQVSAIYFGCPDFEQQTRVIRQKPLMSQTVQQILISMERHKPEDACLWLSALLTSFMEPQGQEAVSAVVRESCRYLEEHLAENVTLEQLSRYCGYSKNQLIRLFKKELGCTPIQYYSQKRIAFAKSQLIYSSHSVRSIAEMTGFYDESYFSKIFKSQVGCSPGQFRSKRRY